jgi:hypothetical protein
LHARTGLCTPNRPCIVHIIPLLNATGGAAAVVPAQLARRRRGVNAQAEPDTVVMLPSPFQEAPARRWNIPEHIGTGEKPAATTTRGGRTAGTTTATADDGEEAAAAAGGGSKTVATGARGRRGASATTTAKTQPATATAQPNAEPAAAARCVLFCGQMGCTACPLHCTLCCTLKCTMTNVTLSLTMRAGARAEGAAASVPRSRLRAVVRRLHEHGLLLPQAWMIIMAVHPLFEQLDVGASGRLDMNHASLTDNKTRFFDCMQKTPL